ncbi:MAG: RNA pseudouridine synthase [Candidatus Paracaedimonas acanthamoebae]|uniref:Pseudouridine synthase n=1 Tax=Candidatus Paracaedimonas acanthamoebae TaxID=244581 RepID=A0A8J7TV81_9PROT|nr:RNA pseudouridine synthase [Candidatus Paracaedimonas acanthamoebae]
MTEPSFNIQSLILYRDAMMLVLNKPSGIAVHAGAKKNNSLDAYFKELTFGLPRLPALAHRLDKDTSGCLVLGRHPEALRRLGHLFETNQIQKTYWAIVKGRLSQKEGIIDLPLAPQSEKKYHWWMKVDPEGKSAITHFKVLGETDDTSWLELKPQTGRTHQLRVHCAALGNPILGDRIYGVLEDKSQLHLHAYSIEIPLYYKKPSIEIKAPSPSYMEAYINKLI